MDDLTSNYRNNPTMSRNDIEEREIVVDTEDGQNTLDDLLEDLGGLGRFQIYLIIGVCTSYMTLGWSMMLVSYSMADTKWYCSMQPINSSSVSDVPWVESTFRGASLGGRNATRERLGSFLRNNNFDTSERLGFSTNNYFTDIFIASKNDTENHNKCEDYGNNSYQACSMNGHSCDSFCFEGDDRTCVTDWDLVCDKEWLRQLITSLQMVGVVIGSLAFGQLSDSYGRKKCFYFALFLHVVVNIVAGFSVSPVMYAVSLLFLGVAIGGFLTVIFPFVVEFLPAKWRQVVSTTPFFSLGNSLVALMAYLFKNWSHLHFGVAIFTFLYIPGWFYFPESIRWLAVHQKQEQAMVVIEKIAKVNKTPVPVYAALVIMPTDQSQRNSRAEARKYTYLDLFRTWRMFLKTIGVGFLWAVMNIAYYGLSLGASNLSGDLYLNIFLMSIVDIPTTAMCFFLSNKIGRRYSGILTFALSTLVSLGLVIVELVVADSSKGTIITVLALAAKLTTSASFAVVYIWGLELYPTVVRNIAFGMSSMFGRLGAVVSPFAINLSSSAVVSFIIMTSGMFVSTLIAIALPETKGVPLPESLTEVKEDEEDEEKTHLLGK